MKHFNTTKFAIFVFIASLMMSSCSTNNEFSKQKYTNFKHGKHPNNLVNNDNYRSKKISKKEVALTTTADMAQPAIVEPMVVSNSSTIKELNQRKTTVTAKGEKRSSATIGLTGKKTAGHGKLATLRAFKATASALKKGSAPAAGDVDLVILIILAIFIPPLAVFLKEGATSRFVIDLILALIAVFGWFWFPFAGLLYLAAIIYALLIVLDKV